MTETMNLAEEAGFTHTRFKQDKSQSNTTLVQLFLAICLQYIL